MVRRRVLSHCAEDIRKCLRALRDCCIDVMRPSSSGVTPLQVAQSQHRSDVVRFLKVFLSEEEAGDAAKNAKLPLLADDNAQKPNPEEVCHMLISTDTLVAISASDDAGVVRHGVRDDTKAAEPTSQIESSTPGGLSEPSLLETTSETIDDGGGGNKVESPRKLPAASKQQQRGKQPPIGTKLEELFESTDTSAKQAENALLATLDTEERESLTKSLETQAKRRRKTARRALRATLREPQLSWPSLRRKMKQRILSRLFMAAKHRLTR